MRFSMLVLFAAALSAQESTNALPRNEGALRNAIAGLGKRPVRLAAQPVRVAPPTGNACSIPLRAMPIDGDREFTARQIPPAETVAMPPLNVPAPPCESAAR